MRSSYHPLLAACIVAAAFSVTTEGAAAAPRASSIRLQPSPAAATLQSWPATVGASLAHAAPLPAARDTGGNRLVAADIAFLQGMIRHHAQAIVMAHWAPSHGASPALRELCKRIAVGQTDEIRLMSNMLRDHGAAVPEADTTDATAMRPGMDAMLMMGMLTQKQLHQLDAARGTAFDRLFLTDMIMHHEGALDMVADLFGSPGAGQDADMFQLASNINSDQTIEIERMTRMLDALAPKSGGR